MNAVLVIMIITLVVVKGMADIYESPEEKAERAKCEARRKMESVLNKYKREVGSYLVQAYLNDIEKYTEYDVYNAEYKVEERNKYRWRRAKKRADEYIERFETQGVVPEYIPAYIVDATPIYYEPKTSFAKNLARIGYEMI